MHDQDDNMVPVVKGIEKKIRTWNNICLAMADGISLIKSVIIPKILYVFTATPIWIEDKTFK